jgi:DNA-directed RNA polymerase specialized sigma24 family protein
VSHPEADLLARSAQDQITALYRVHGMDLIRIAAVMLGSRASAEDAVHDAFCGLFRHWNRIGGPDKALPYVRSEEHLEVLAALTRLPARQREALVLRYFIDLDEPQIAMAMGISQGTVKSTTSRALSALARQLEERP